MAKIRYTPRPGAAWAPTLEPQQVIEVSHAEAEHLLATGAFEPVTDETAATADEPPQRARKGRE